MPILQEMDYNSDEEIDKKKHARLLNEVLQLDQRPIVKKPSRTEPTTHVSEFNLVRSVKNSINLNDLTESFKQKSKHAAIRNKIKSAQKARTLHKPLEKPQAERIRRTVGFKKSKSELNKWNSIVEKNRVASQISYPLNQIEIDIIADPIKAKSDTIKRYKSELDIELEKLEPNIQTIHVEDKFPLSMDEIIQRRREIAKLRAHQSYQEAKAYKKKKIKSKTYHRIKRKEKLKQQIKEFELLQKTDPEEALKKLEQLEKTRVEERMSLRHRSTGAWAKNKQICAKYDKNSRQALAQQLSLSRELTQKSIAASSDSETEIDATQTQIDTSNPWIMKSAEVGDFISGYRKYWNEMNNNNNNNNNKQHKIDAIDKHVKESIGKKKEKVKQIKTKIKHCNSSWTVTSISNDDESSKCLKKQDDVECIFEHLEDVFRSKAKQKLTKLQTVVASEKKRKFEKDSKQFVQKSDRIDLKRERVMRPELDDELQNMNEEDSGINQVDELVKTLDYPLGIEENKKVKNVDPNNYLEVKSKVVKLDTKSPDIYHEADNTDNDEEQKHFIQEAFADDNIVNEFTIEKNNIIDRNKPKDIDLTLPGWGTWGGKNIKPSNRKRKRFIIKMPQDLPRRDQNKGNLIINEHKSKQMKKHQISEIPFPFTSVQDFEASIRAPIGDTFVPQTAFRRLIKPAVVTKKGTIIEPMTDSVLLKQKFTQNGFMINKN